MTGHRTKTTNARDKGFTLVELLIVVAIILIIAAIAIPSLIRSKIAANEASAVGTMRTLNTEFVTYAAVYGIGFPADLSDLGPSTSPTSTAADLIDVVLESGTKAGYIFTFTPGTPSTTGVINTYTLTGTPITLGSSGQRGFYTDQSMVIRENPGGIATVTDKPIS